MMLRVSVWSSGTHVTASIRAPGGLYPIFYWNVLSFCFLLCFLNESFIKRRHTCRKMQKLSLCNWVNFHKMGTPMYSKLRSRNRIFWPVTLGLSHHDPAFGAKAGYYPNVTPWICSAFLNFRQEELCGIITWVRLWFPVGSNCWWVLVPLKHPLV